jgi:hypothetical protein
MAVHRLVGQIQGPSPVVLGHGLKRLRYQRGHPGLRIGPGEQIVDGLAGGVVVAEEEPRARGQRQRLRSGRRRQPGKPFAVLGLLDGAARIGLQRQGADPDPDQCLRVTVGQLTGRGGEQGPRLGDPAVEDQHPGDAGDDPGPGQVAWWHQFQCPAIDDDGQRGVRPADLGRRPGEKADGQPVARLRHLQHQRDQLGRRRGVVQPYSHRTVLKRREQCRRDTGGDRVADQIVAEAEPVVLLDQETRDDGLPDGVQHGHGLATGHLGQLGAGEPLSQRRTEQHRVPGTVGQPSQMPVHQVPDPTGKVRRGQPGAAVRDLHPAFLAPPPEQLDQQQRLRLDTRQRGRQVRLGFGTQHITDDVGDRGQIQGADVQPGRPVAREPVERGHHQRPRLLRAGGEQPQDPVSGQPIGEDGECRQRRRVGPLEIIDHQHHRRLQRRALDRLPHRPGHPETVAGRLAQGAGRLRVEQGGRAVQQEGQQRVQRSRAGEDVAPAAPDQEAPTFAEVGGFVQEAGLTHSGGAVDHHHAPAAGDQSVYSLAQHPLRRLTAAEDGCRPGRVEHCHDPGPAMVSDVDGVCQ